MPGVHRLSIDALVEAVGEAIGLGIPAVALFPAVSADKKTPGAEEAINPDNLVCRAIRAVKAVHADRIGVMGDVALDPYSSHGQDGLVRDGYVVNDETVSLLCRQASLQALPPRGVAQQPLLESMTGLRGERVAQHKPFHGADYGTG